MSKSPTPLVDSLNIPTFKIATRDGWEDATLIKDIEAALEKLTKVTGAIDGNGNFHVQNHSSYDTHTARLLGIQEITKEPMKVEHIVSFPEGHRCYAINGEEFGSKLAGKKFKVTYEEFEG